MLLRSIGGEELLKRLDGKKIRLQILPRKKHWGGEMKCNRLGRRPPKSPVIWGEKKKGIQRIKWFTGGRVTAR